MNKIIPPRLTWDKIRNIAIDARNELLTDPNDIPVPIEEIIEFKLGMSIEPKTFLKEEYGIDGQILGDLSTIMIDNKMYSDERYLPRVRFTLAHELGHYYLHKKQIKETKFSSIEEWIKVLQNTSDQDSIWFERQADEFAGSFLVPINTLVKLIEDERNKIELFLKKSKSEELHEKAIYGISINLCRKFYVSYQVIETRINQEKIWDELGFYNI